jgi:Ca2+/Na+ antiporter
MGTIVGSAMFNILVIVALSAAIAGKGGGSLAIDYRPVARDVGFYTYSILLCWIFFADGVIELYEAAIMWISYIVYIVFMVFNEKYMAMLPPPASAAYKVSPDEKDAAEAAAKALEGTLGGDSSTTEGGGEGEKKEGGDDDDDE